MTSDVKYFCDTTIVYYMLTSHSRMKSHVLGMTKQGMRTMSLFVKGEFIRGYIKSLILLYCAIKEENSVQDGFQIFAMSAGKRGLGNALTSSTMWLMGHEDSENVNKTLRRLGELIRRMLFEFDFVFSNRVLDPLKCQVGSLSFREETYSEQQIIEFFAEMEIIRRKPECDQCDFKAEQISQLDKHGIDLYGPSQQEAHKSSKGFVKQAKVVEKAVRSPLEGPSCWYCTQISDTIISLAAPPTQVILTGDKSSFVALGDILGKTVKIVPSLNELRSKDSTK